MPNPPETIFLLERYAGAKTPRSQFPCNISGPFPLQLSTNRRKPNARRRTSLRPKERSTGRFIHTNFELHLPMNATAKLAAIVMLLSVPDLLSQTYFTKITSGEIVTDAQHSYGCSWADYDNDGDLDLFVTNFGPPAEDFFYRNNGDGTFTQVTEGVWVNDTGAGVGAAWSDYDNDGFVDLVVANSNGQADFLYRNNGNGQMDRIMAGPIPTAGRNSMGCAWGDFDGDGDADLAIAAGNGGPTPPLFTFRNEGEGGFEQVTRGSLIVEGSVGVGLAWGDFDNSGVLDLFVARGGSARAESNLLFKDPSQDFGGRVTEGEVVEDVEWSVGCAWGDFDNDGYLDLFVANGHQQSDTLYRNRGDGSFERILNEDLSLDYATTGGCCWGDYNNDGFLDLFVAAGGGESANDPLETNLLYRNNGNTNSWLLVRLTGTVSNRAAIGAKVRASAVIQGAEMWQLREVSGGSGYCSQSDLRAHFGLGDATTVDLLRTEWPSGIVQELKDVAANQILTVTEPPRLIPQGAGAFQILCWINQGFDVEASTDLATWSSVATLTGQCT